MWSFARVASVLALLFASGCMAFVPRPDGTWTYGQTADGVLLSGVRLADHGEGFVRARPGEETRFGTPTMLNALMRGAAGVMQSYPGSAPLRIGDIAYPNGGRHPRHGSHRTGRDVDVIFYVTDAAGRSVRGRGWLAFDRFGAARETTTPEGMTPTNELFFFDDARNWHFVRTLLLDDSARVQWVFCSRGVKSRLLAYAIAHEPDPEAIVRASWVLHQPSRGHPHNDHFRVRVGCTPEEMADGCWSRGPIWPWQRGEDEKPAQGTPTAVDDETLITALLGDEPADQTDEVAAR